MQPALPPGLSPGGRFSAWARVAPALVVADVDGTLIGPTATASDEVVAAVRRAAAAGLPVGFATGRMRLAVEPLWQQLRLPGPHILHNGAEVRAGGATVRSWPVPPAALEALLRSTGDRPDAYTEIYVEDGFLVSRRDERARPHWELLGHEPLGVLRAGDHIGEAVLKATVAVFDHADPAPIVEAVQQAGLRAGTAGSPLTPQLTYVNATHVDAHKGHALAAAAAHVGLDASQVAVIGDALNDLPMLEIAGTAIAMGQSPQAVRDAAHLVAPDVHADGVAAALDACLAWRAADGIR